MVCKKCNELKKKASHEIQKKEIVRDYIRDWKKWMLVLFLSVINYGIFVLLAVSPIMNIPMVFRWCIMLVFVSLFLFTLGVISRTRFGLLHFSALMLWAGPVTGFQTPIVDLVFFFLAMSLILLFIEVAAGVKFKIKVIPVERPWSFQKVNNNYAKRGKHEDN